MPRKIEPKCLVCSRLSSQEAQRIHGEEGDGCWDPAVCYRRRSHYRNRGDVNAKRRGQRLVARAQAEAGASDLQTFVVPVVLPTVAMLYLYREARKNAHLHALAITVWRGEEKVAEVPPIHCVGMTNRQVNQYLRDVLEVLNQQYRITQFEPEIRLEPSECPIDPCPLRGR